MSRLIKNYIKDHVKGIIVFVIYTAILAFTFFIFNLPLESILYAFLVSLFPIFIITVIDFMFYRRRYIEIKTQEDNIINTLAKIEVTGSSTEKELVVISNKLTDRIEELSRKSSKEQKEAEDYYTMWVHQVKTPIAAMRLILQQENADSIANVALLKQELFRIERYTEMALNYQRLSSNSSDLSFKMYNVHEIAKKAVKKYAPIFIHKKISVNLHEFSNRVITDEKWLGFIIEQLLSNALKYTNRGEGIIEIYMDENDMLYIKDNGVGISKEDLPRIFEKGYTGMNGRETNASTGLGLFLCKKTTEKLENTIEIESQEGIGTTAKLNLYRDTFVSGD